MGHCPLNPVSKLDRYPIPKVEDLFANLSGGCTFTKIDLSQAYQQVPLEEESQKYVVINTHKGLFKYTRLPFGVSSWYLSKSDGRSVARNSQSCRLP